MTVRIIKNKKAKPTRHLRAIKLNDGLPAASAIIEELQDMTDVLMGREEPPLQAGVLTMMETADAYYARAAELTMLIQTAEREGRFPRGSGYYKIRTGELRTFMEMAKRAADLGSRRVTVEQMRQEAERTGRDSRY